MSADIQYFAVSNRVYFLSNNVGIHFLFTYYFPIRSFRLVPMFSGSTPRIVIRTGSQFMLQDQYMYHQSHFHILVKMSTFYLLGTSDNFTSFAIGWINFIVILFKISNTKFIIVLLIKFKIYFEKKNCINILN